MSKILKRHEEVTIADNGIHTTLSSGYKMAFIAITVENEEGEKFSGVTLNYKGYAQSFAVVVNDGTSLYGYALPVTTVAGLFATKEEFLFDDETKFSSNTPLVSKFDNNRIFRRIEELKAFTLVASASGQLFDRRKDKSIGKTPPTWTMWGVRECPDKPSREGDMIIWGNLSINIEDVAEKVAKAHDALCDRLNA